MGNIQRKENEVSVTVFLKKNFGRCLRHRDESLEVTFDFCTSTCPRDPGPVKETVPTVGLGFSSMTK